MIRLCSLAAGLVSLLAICPPAAAISPPVADPAAPPPNAAPSPSPVAQRAACTTPGVIPGTDPGAQNANQRMLNLAAAWQFSRGEGQTVAIIDTGVKPGPRLPNVDPGGDYVEATDGLVDCDGHGTLVAGIVAGQPGADGFSGVAPAARLVSIRQTSAKFSPRVPADNPAIARAALDVDTLARAIVRAADLGARVINVSAVTCLPADKTVDQTALGAALRYAAVEKDAVVVAAAGNVGAGNTGSSCEANPLSDPADPDDSRNWAGVVSISIPAWWQPYTLSVGSLTPEGRPSPFTMPGPWLGVAAPGENVASVTNGPDGGLANGLPDNDGDMAPISGTSYAAAYVSGVAALVRSRYPDLTAQQVVHRIAATAHNAARSPSNLVGAGTLDPVAALTWEVPAAAPEPRDAPAKPIAAPPEPAPVDPTPRLIAFSGVGLLTVAVLAAAAVAARRRKDEST